jgi:hypothetical protein
VQASMLIITPYLVSSEHPISANNVEVELTPYDLGEERIVYRDK